MIFVFSLHPTRDAGPLIFGTASGKLPFWPVLLFLFLFFLTSPVAPGFTAEEKPEAAKEKDKDKDVLVTVTAVERKSLDPKIALPGTVLPVAITQLAAEIGGRVDEVLFTEGDFVKKGQVLVQLRTVPFELERDHAVAEKNRVAATLEELKNGTRPEVIAAGLAVTKQAEARLKLAEIELKRIEKLYKEGVVSINEYDKFKALAEEELAKYNEKKAQIDEMIAGPRVERIKQETATLAAAQSRIEMIEDKIARCSMTAPFDGIVVKQQAEVGFWLEPGDPALVLITATPVLVEVHLPQFYFDSVDLGTPAKVTLEGRGSDSPNKDYKGTVVEKIYNGDAVSRTFPIRIKVDNRRNEIASGMLLQVELQPKGATSHKMYIPKDAIVRTPNETHVWIIRSGQKNQMTADKIEVTPGTALGNLISIDSSKAPIKPGDLVVVHGNERLRPGATVKIVRELD